MTISVVLADDQDMVRMGFSLILDAAQDISVIGQAADGVDAIALIQQHRPDVALLDIRMPRLDGLEVTKRVSSLTNVVIVTTFGDDDAVDTALANGACGFILKDSGPSLLLAAVRAAAEGDALISPQLTLSLLQRRKDRAVNHDVEGLESITDREQEVANLVAQGMTNTEIAEKLFISLSTVKSHLTNIQNRLGARNRVEIAAAMWRSGRVQ